MIHRSVSQGYFEPQWRETFFHIVKANPDTPGSSLKFNGAPRNIQSNIDRYVFRAFYVPKHFDKKLKS